MQERGLSIEFEESAPLAAVPDLPEDYAPEGASLPPIPLSDVGPDGLPYGLGGMRPAGG